MFFADVLRDPLSEVSRKERTYLLGTSVVGIAILRTGLVPTRITALGIEFEQADQEIFLLLLGLVVLYFLAAFIVYAASDFLAWWEGYRAALAAIKEPKLSLNKELAIRREELIHETRIPQEGIREGDTIPPEIGQRLDAAAPELARLDRTRRTGVVVAIIRALLEYPLPLVLGGYAAYILIC